MTRVSGEKWMDGSSFLNNTSLRTKQLKYTAWSSTDHNPK